MSRKFAQPVPVYDWSRGTPLSGFGGFGGDDTGSGSLFGGSVGWDASPRIAIEGNAAWMQFDDPGESFRSSARASASITPRSGWARRCRPSFRLHRVFVFEDHPVTPARRR